MIPWKIRLFFLFCSKSYLQQSFICVSFFVVISYIFSCISSRMWFIISNRSLVLLVKMIVDLNDPNQTALISWNFVINKPNQTCLPPFLPPEILICTLAAGGRDINNWRVQGWSLSGQWSWSYLSLPVPAPHGQSRGFYQCTRPDNNCHESMTKVKSFFVKSILNKRSPCILLSCLPANPSSLWHFGILQQPFILGSSVRNILTFYNTEHRAHIPSQSCASYLVECLSGRPAGGWSSPPPVWILGVDL